MTFLIRENKLIFEVSIEGFFLAPWHCKLKLSVCLFFSFLFFSLSFSFFLFKVETSTAFLLTSVRLQSREQVQKDTGCPFRCYFSHHSLLRCYYVIHHGRCLHSALITAPAPSSISFPGVPHSMPLGCHKEDIFSVQKMVLVVFWFKAKSHLPQADLELMI